MAAAQSFHLHDVLELLLLELELELLPNAL
jgi:hypothetical protein